jgi:hypothetical protein
MGLHRTSGFQGGRLVIDRDRLAKLLERERATFRERHPRSLAAYRAAGASLFGGVPMTWMNKAAGGFPVYLAQVRGALVTDLDGHRYARRERRRAGRPGPHHRVVEFNDLDALDRELSHGDRRRRSRRRLRPQP